MSNSSSKRAAPMTYTRFSLVKSTPSLWRVTFDNPPINLIDAVMMKELLNLLTEIERDKRVGVVLFDSADPDFFLAHYDIAGDPAELEGVETTAGRHPFTELHIRLSKSPAVTISAIRGRARGAGSEFALATDIRFASRERAVLGQFEIGVGAAPGGGALNRLSSLVGRARGERHVHGGPLTGTGASLGDEAGTGEEELAGLVDRDREHARVVVEDRLHPVAVVHIDVDVRDALRAVGEQPRDRDGGVVIDAEPARSRGHRMVETPCGVEGVLGGTLPDGLRRSDRRTGDVPHVTHVIVAQQARRLAQIAQSSR